jgi:nucleoside-diphosphate-sugar epimerase
MQEILVIGGTGAQGLPVVHGNYPFHHTNISTNIVAALSSSNHFSVRVLTRDTTSARAKQLAELNNVTLIQGAQDNQKDLHRAFKGVYGAWVNTDGFTLGEKNELFYGIRAYEIARHEGLISISLGF